MLLLRVRLRDVSLGVVVTGRLLDYAGCQAGRGRIFQADVPVGGLGECECECE